MEEVKASLSSPATVYNHLQQTTSSQSKRMKKGNDTNGNDFSEFDHGRSDSLLQALSGMQRRGDLCDLVIIPIGDVSQVNSSAASNSNSSSNDRGDTSQASSSINTIAAVAPAPAPARKGMYNFAIRIHSVVAAASSSVLSGMISRMNMSGNIIELPCQLDALQSIVTFMYSGNLELGRIGNSPTLVLRVRKLAEYLNMKSAVDICDQFLKQTPSSNFELKRTLKGHSAYVYDICLCGTNRKYLASGSRDQTIVIWDTLSGDKLKEIQGHRDRVFALLSVNGIWDSSLNGGKNDKLVSASWDFTVKVWDTETWNLEQTLEGHTGWVTAITQVENRYLVSGSADTTIRVYDMLQSPTNWEVVRVLRGHEKAVYSLIGIPSSSSSTGNCAGTIVSGSEDATIRIWSIRTWQCLKVLSDHTGTVRSLAVYEDLLLSGSADSTIKVWRIESGICEQTLNEHSDWVESLCIIDSRRIASASRDGTIKVWKIGTWKCLQTLTGHSHWVYSLALMNDGSLASASADMSIKIWTQEETSNGQSSSPSSSGRPMTAPAPPILSNLEGANNLQKS